MGLWRGSTRWGVVEERRHSDDQIPRKKTLIIGLINICACLSTDYSTVHYIIAVLRWFSKFLRNDDDDDDDDDDN